MPNYVQYSTSIPSGSIKKGTVALGINDAVAGPTSNAGWYTGINPPTGSYTVYEVAATGDPDIYCPINNTELINLVRSKGATGANTGSVAAALAWIATQNNLLATNEVYPNIVTSGSVIMLDAGFVGSYPTTASKWYDISGYNNSGSLLNNPTFNSNGAIVLDGIDDYVSQNYYTATNFVNNQSWTIDVLINVLSSQSAANTTGGVLTNQRYQSEPDPGGFGLNIINKNYCVNLTSGSTGNAITNEQLAQTPINYTKNERITALFNSASSTVSIYRNGVLANTTTNANYKWSTRSSGVLQSIGTSTQGGWGYFFPMKLYNVSLYNRALTQAEISQNYYQAPIVTSGLVFAVDAGNLVSYESGSTTTYSLTGSISGSLVNGVTYNNNSGGSWDFDGTDDYLNFSAPSALNFTSSNAFSTEAWINWDGGAQPNNAGHIIGKTYGNYRTFFINSINPGIISFRLGLNTLNCDTPSIISANTWYQVVSTFNPSTFTSKVYVNGVERASNTNVNINWSATNGNFQIGNSPGENYYFNGNITNGRVYNKTLTPEEVSQNFNAQKARFGL
jgi:hypothetical protein